MAGLFENILENIKEKKQEGKIQGGYRYKDGKLNIGGGYYGDDSMFEVDVNKDGGNILFKKRFADGGSTNGSGEKAFTAKVKELMDDGYELGEAVKEAMRQGYNKGGKARLPSSVKKQTLYDKLLKELPEGYLEDYKKIFLNDRGDGTFSRKPGDKGGIETMEQKYGDTIKEIKTRQGNIKNVPRKIGEFNSAILQNLQKENKIVSGLKDAKEIRKADLKILGTFSPTAPKGMTTHHFMPLAGIEGESLNLSSTKNTAFISSKLNSKMSPYDKKLKANQKEQIKLLKEKPEGWKTRLNQLNFKAKKIYKEAGKKVPGSKGYLGYSQIILKPDGSYDIKVTGIDSNKSIAGLKGEEIFYKDIEKGNNRTKVKKLTETYITRNKPTTLANSYYKEMLENYEKNFDSLSPRDKMPMYQNATKRRMQSMAKLYAKYGKDVVDDAIQKNSINLDDLTKPGSTSDRRKALERKIKRGPPSLKSDAFGIGTAIEEGPRALKKAGQLGLRGASKVLGYGAIPLELYFMNEARKQGKSTAEILAMPLLMEGRVEELQDMMKLTPVERQGYNRAKINEDESLLDTDFYTPDKEGIEFIDNEATKDYIKKSRKLEEALRREDRSKPKQRFTLPNLTGILEDEV